MKKFILLLAITFFALQGYSQLGVTKGLSVGTMLESKTNISNAELKTLDGNTRNIATGYLAVDDSINPILDKIIYSAEAVDSIADYFVFRNFKQMIPKALSISSCGYTLLGGTAPMVSGYMYCNEHTFKKDTVITKVSTFTATTGNYVVTDSSQVYNGFVIYQKTATGLTELTRTVNDPNVWKQSVSSTPYIITKTLKNPITVTKGTKIIVACVYNKYTTETTAPSLPSLGSIASTFPYFIPYKRIPVFMKTGVLKPASTYTWSEFFGYNSILGIWTE